jgi:hypothetical protein
MKTENVFPEHIKDEFPDFIAFLELYYEFMNSARVTYISSDSFHISDIITGVSSGSSQAINGVDGPNNILFIPSRSDFEIGETFTGSNGRSGIIVSIDSNPSQTIEQILEIRNPDGESALSYMFDKYRSEFMPSLPKRIFSDVNKKTLIKRIRDIYKEKGTNLSFKAVFKLLFNEFLEIKYPAYEMLVPSSGIWESSYSFIINLDTDSDNPISLRGNTLNVTPTGSGSLPSIFDIRIDQIRRLTLAKCEVFFKLLPLGIDLTTDISDYKVKSADSLITGVIDSTTLINNGGKYKGTDGFLSDSNKLQSKYYQKYSYVLQSDVPANMYSDIFKSIVHPAGLLSFDELIISNLVSVTHVIKEMKVGFLKDFYHGIDTYDNNVNDIIKVLTDIILSIDNKSISINKLIPSVPEDIKVISDSDSNYMRIDSNPYAYGYFDSPATSSDSYTDIIRLL